MIRKRSDSFHMSESEVNVAGLSSQACKRKKKDEKKDGIINN